MRLSVVNHTRGLLSDEEVQTAVRAVNRQIAEDFAPYWNVSGTLRLEGISSGGPRADDTIDMQGEAILYIWDEADVPDALGYHEANYRGIPYGFVFVDIATELGENWTVTFSHEALELLGDRQANLLVQGPHPEQPQRTVYHWREMCDAVQTETYFIDDVEVSNFVLPLYFTAEPEAGSRNDFLGRLYESANGEFTPLPSFGVNPGGYVGFYDPMLRDHATVKGKKPRDVAGNGPRDKRQDPTFRQQRKNKARQARRGNRYAENSPPAALQRRAIPAKKTAELVAGKRKLTVRCKTHDLDVSTGLQELRHETHKRAGHFAYDIRRSAKGLSNDLEKGDFTEIPGAALEINPGWAEPGTKAPIVQVSIEHGAEEGLLAMVEVDGVVFFHPPRKTRDGASKFNLPLQQSRPPNRGRRGSFLGRVSKTVIRFIKHELTDSVKEWIQDRLGDYLAEQVEALAFRKEISGRIDEFCLRDDPSKLTLHKPVNHQVGELVPWSDEQSLPSDKSYLLFIHGIFSSTKGAFQQVLVNRQDELLRTLSARYDHVIGFDHWTVAKSTLENAAELLALLPRNCRLDIVCHSRGAGVTRCLLEHPDLAPKLRSRDIKVGKVVFVAGACQGSPLALPERIGTLVNVASVVSSVGGGYLSTKLFTSLLKAVQYGVTEFPGIASMSPKSPIIEATNGKQYQPGSHYITMRSNYEPAGRLAEMLDGLALDRFVFKGERNDGVVPFDGAATFDERVQQDIHVTASAEFGQRQPESVFHTNFFSQKAVRQGLLKHLTGN
jgi:hypothetical protein